MAIVRGHRGFAACWDWATKHESKIERGLRRDAGAKTRGRVLELGVGVGANWPYLAEDLDYVGIEPDSYMLQRAHSRAEAAGQPRKIEQAAAEQLPFDDASFDTVLVTLTLCTVQDPARALAEAKRVLRPGGQLVFVEHVRPENTLGAWLIDRITPLWHRAFAGCHPNRRTAQALAEAGFEIEGLERRVVNGPPMISGTARNDAAQADEVAHG
jgi:ubiquinone/menaquinone biosynthesis C-methylase UbiE